MARFQNCVMLFKIAARFPDIWALEDILVPVSCRTKSKKTPFLARPEPISNTVYIYIGVEGNYFAWKRALN